MKVYRIAGVGAVTRNFGVLWRIVAVVALLSGVYALPRHQIRPSSPSTIVTENLPRSAPATSTSLVEAFSGRAARGSASAKGVVIWSHGRSLTHEDSTSSTPLYLASFAASGWDVLRFDRPRAIDTLKRSTADLVDRVRRLHEQGYRRIVLAGQSYGGFIALGAARDNANVDAVIATAPAAYGSFFDSYESWQANGKALEQLLHGLGRTRVALAFFHGDDYDPGGRGAAAREILTAQHTPFLLIDQPRDLVGHLAANTGLFVRRYAGCLVAFAEATSDTASKSCDDSWGLEPSTALLTEPRTDAGTEGRQTGASAEEPASMSGRWYGYYPNGREF